MKVITVTNQKGGVGKTALALHLALAGQELGLSVLLIDLDSQGSASITLTGDAIAVRLERNQALVAPEHGAHVTQADRRRRVDDDEVIGK